MSPLIPRTARAALGAAALFAYASAAPQEVASSSIEGADGPFAELDTAAAKAPFRILDNVEGPHVDLGLFPVRPMALSDDLVHLYAVNTHDSTVERSSTTLRTRTPDAGLAPFGPPAWRSSTSSNVTNLRRYGSPLLPPVTCMLAMLAAATSDRCISACSAEPAMSKPRKIPFIVSIRFSCRISS